MARTYNKIAKKKTNMPQWIDNTKKRIQELQKEGYFNSWPKLKNGPITFFVNPGLYLSEDWTKKRLNVYEINAGKLRIRPPKIKFFVFPSMEAGQEIGITPAITFIKEKEIYGHLKQSPGHELTHILLGEINLSENLPANGLWAEGVCVYLDGTDTNRKKHANSLDYSEEIINTPWSQWRKNLPGNLYPLAGSVIQFCDEKFGWKTIVKFLKAQRNFGENDEELSQKIFGISYQELQRNWREWLKK